MQFFRRKLLSLIVFLLPYLQTLPAAVFERQQPYQQTLPAAVVERV